MNRNSTAKRIGELPLWTLSLGQLTCSLVIIMLFCHRYQLSYTVVGWHLFLIIGGWLSLFAVSLGLCSFTRLRNAVAFRYLLAACYAVCFYVLIVFYGFAFIGQHFWGASPTYQLLKAYVPYVPTLLRTLPVNPFWFYAALILLGGVMALIYLVYWASLLPGLQRCLCWCHRINPYLLRLGGLVIAGVFIVSAGQFLPRARKAGEPIGVFCSSNTYQYKEMTGSLDTYFADWQSYPTDLAFIPKHVILIVVDSLRADHTGVYGYARETTPFLTKLARQGQLHKVEQAFATCGSSFCSLLSILTAKPWQHISYRNFGLPDVLKRAGYLIYFIAVGDHTNFYNLRHFYGEQIDYYVDGYTSKAFGLNDDRLVAAELAHLPPASPTHPLFLFVHLMSAHILGEKQPEFQQYRPCQLSPGQDREAVTLNYTNNYDNGILQADDVIRQIFAGLDEKGYLNHALVIITADHGEAVGDRGYLGHTSNLFGFQLNIPLLIYDSDATASYPPLPSAAQVDIAPTILDRLGLPIPDSWEGLSLFASGPRQPSFHRENDNFGVIAELHGTRYKYIYHQHTGFEELYDLQHDPQEMENLTKIVHQEFLTIFRNVAQTGFQITISAKQNN